MANATSGHAAPTLTNIARAAGVSKSLVSLALRGEAGVGRESRSLILKTAACFGRSPSVYALRALGGVPNVIGAIVTDIANPFHTDVVAGLERAAEPRGYSVVTMNGARDVSVMRRHLATLGELGVRGAAVVSTWIPDDILSAAAAHRPVVVIGSSAAPVDGTDTVGGNAALGVRQTVEHMIAIGHQRIAFVAESERSSSTRRHAAYLQEMDRLYHDDATTSVHIDDLTDVPSLLRDVVVNRGFTGFIAANDMTAIRLIDLAERDGFAVPADLAVAGYDNTLYGRTTRPKLTTVDQPRELMGQLAFDMIIERLDGRTTDRHDTVNPLLMPRESTLRSNPRLLA